MNQQAYSVELRHVFETDDGLSFDFSSTVQVLAESLKEAVERVSYFCIRASRWTGIASSNLEIIGVRQGWSR